MAYSSDFDVIIIGGSYSGLSAAMALGRSLRKVLLIDSGLPCNRQTPHSHNFITQDGEKPDTITEKAKAQVLNYPTVKFLSDTALSAEKTDDGYAIAVKGGKAFTAGKLIFATGIKDIMPDIKGFSACWGISVVHCPYCHGYEVKDEVTGILDNGDSAMHYAGLVSNLTKNLTIFTNGKSSFTDEHAKKLERNNIKVEESAIERFEDHHGQIQKIVFKNGSSTSIKVLYAKVPFVQHSDIPEKLGCELTEQGFIKVNSFLQTNIQGVLACGDNTTYMRSIASAVATGNFAGAMANKELCEERF